MGFSSDFLKAGIEAMSAIREWRAALVHAVQNNYPLSEEWLGNFRRTAKVSEPWSQLLRPPMTIAAPSLCSTTKWR